MTPGQLYPGIDAAADDDPAAAALKGDLRMADVVASAVRARQRVPDGPRRLDVQGDVVTLTPGMVAASRDRARAARKPHNRARRTFVLSLLDRLAAALAKVRGVDAEAYREELLADLRDSKDVRREVNLAWMPLTPAQVVDELLSDPARLAAAAPRLSAREREALLRPKGSPWTVSDVPLLDEAAELLGADDEEERRAAARAASDRARESEYAQGVLEITGTSTLTADQLLDRYAGAVSRRSVAEAAETDREWAFGHVVVDEAQELSAMAWRVLMRRCPTRSMTVVGDLDQTGSAAGVRDWADVFDRYAPGRWSTERLTVNYRTPRPVMDLALDVLRASGRPTSPVTSARDGDDPVFVRLDPDRLADDVAEAVRAELAALGGGRLALLVPRGQREGLARAIGQRLPKGSVGSGLQALDAPVSVLAVADAKGLEFDVVVVVEPTAMAVGASGARDLYVALSRPTRRLLVLHAEPLPDGFPPGH